MPVSKFIKHAERFGAEGVMEEASKTLGFDDLVTLQLSIDEHTKPKPKLTAQTRVRRLLGLDEKEAA